MCNKKIALTGGIATGKTTVANLFRDLGATVLDADVYARRVVEPGAESWQALRDMIGPAYFDPAGSLNRRKLREKIIEEPDLREKLDALLHPFIIPAMWADWERLKRSDPRRVVIFDIPLLFEGGFETKFDIVILVYVPPCIQIQRLAKRDGITLQEA